MTYQQILKELEDNGGAILCWQVSDRTAFDDAFKDGAIEFDADSDCYVHPRAIADCDGHGWTMPDPATCRHRDDGRGICCDCGTIINGHHRHFAARAIEGK